MSLLKVNEVTDLAGDTPAGVGRILQVVSTVKTDQFTTNSATFTTVTGLTATITPSSTNSKILVISQIAYGFNGAGEGFGHYKVTRGGTDVYVGDASGSRIRAVFGGFNGNTQNRVTNSGSIVFLDSPSTTLATTYQVDVRKSNASDTFAINSSGADPDNDTSTRGASSITLMEVAD
jgi:hypothetical protein